MQIVSRSMLFLAVLALSAAASARGIHYGAVAEPAVVECDQQHWRGRVEESRLCYANLLRAETPASIKAEAAWALNNPKQANEWFRTAMSETPDDHATKVRWGDLFAASHQYGEAMNIYREVLAEEPANAFALLGAATVLVGSFEDAADNYLQPILDGVVPDDGAYLGALLLIARVALENGDYDEAEASLALAEDVLAKHDWPPLELYALRASLDLLNDVADSRWTELSLAYNPYYGNIYATPAHFYVITRRYREAIEMYQKAVEIQPSLAAAHEQLGINLLRENRMSLAREHLERAYELDPFSPRSVNTLRLMDSFGNFRLVDDPPTVDGEVPIILRLHKDESAALAPYAIELTRDSIDVFTERYGFALREPVVIEMYPDHEDFAVRTAGMPGLGILGATFGYVIAMDSPSGRPSHQFQWGTTLWHEMAHVFTLEATDHLVPRWYSEGLSVFEEWRSGPNPGVRIPMSVYNAMKEDLFLPITELDEGFLRPTYENQVIVSYMQAGIVCDYIDREFGDGKLRELLYAYRDGLNTEEAIRSVLGVSPESFDETFAAFVDTEHGPVLAQLDRWHADQVRYNNAISEKDWATAIELAAGLIAILPQYVEPDSPYLAAAMAQRELGDNEAAINMMQTFWRNGGYDPVALRRYAEWLVEAGRSADAIDVLYSINLVDPLDHELHGNLGDLLLAAGRADEALREYEVAISLQPHDMATAWYRLAQAQYELGNVEQSQLNLLQALDVAPNFRPAQRLLLKLASNNNGQNP
jgi:tetratricopeptide (TPR) repeat protein